MLFAGCITVKASGNIDLNTSSSVPATSGGTTSTGDELPPLPPDNEAIASTTAQSSEELPPMPN